MQNMESVSIKRTLFGVSNITVTNPPYLYNDRAIYKCKPGYVISTSSLRMCHGRKNWTNQNATCARGFSWLAFCHFADVWHAKYLNCLSFRFWTKSTYSGFVLCLNYFGRTTDIIFKSLWLDSDMTSLLLDFCQVKITVVEISR